MTPPAEYISFIWKKIGMTPPHRGNKDNFLLYDTLDQLHPTIYVLLI